MKKRTIKIKRPVKIILTIGILLIVIGIILFVKHNESIASEEEYIVNKSKNIKTKIQSTNLMNTSYYICDDLNTTSPIKGTKKISTIYSKLTNFEDDF